VLIYLANNGTTGVVDTSLHLFEGLFAASFLVACGFVLGAMALAVAAVPTAWMTPGDEATRSRARRALGTALLALSLACAGRELHGRPNVSISGCVELILVLAFAIWELSRVLLGRATFFSHLLIALVALWQGLDLVPTLVNGYVLIPLPAGVARAVAVICLGCAVCLGLLALRDGDRPEIQERRRRRRARA